MANQSILAHNNKYGYKINVNHPNIKPYYERFKRKKGGQVLSDNDRFEFETILLAHIEKQRAKGECK